MSDLTSNGMAKNNQVGAELRHEESKNFGAPRYFGGCDLPVPEWVQPDFRAFN
jgi:hypothetical protein